MTISDALPVQFWLSDCDTYNETVPKGVHEACFCAPWQCDDEIRIQFQDDTSPEPEFSLLIKNADGDYVVQLPFTEVEAGTFARSFTPRDYSICDEDIALEIFNDEDITLVKAPSQWSDDDVLGYGSFDTKGASAFTESVTSATGFIAAFQDDVAVPVGTTITIPVTVQISGTWSGEIDFLIFLSDALGNIRSTDSTTDTRLLTANGTYTINFTLTGATATSQRMYLQLSEFVTSGTAVVSITVPVGNLVYASGEDALAKSDCLNIATIQNETQLFEYANGRNFAGLIYQDISPDAAFYIRVPCRFFHEEFPEEDEAIELTSQVVTTSSQLKSQKLLEVKHVPYYFHKKLQLVLKHQTLEVGNTAYKKEEKYTINKGNMRWPMKSATCLLTEKNSVLRNTL